MNIVWWIDPDGEFDAANVSCCTDMTSALGSMRSGLHPNENLSLTVGYSEIFAEFGLVMRDAELAQLQLIRNCPWCGVALPESKRDDWFDELQALGWDMPLNTWNQLPASYKTSEWRKGRVE